MQEMSSKSSTKSLILKIFIILNEIDMQKNKGREERIVQREKLGRRLTLFFFYFLFLESK